MEEELEESSKGSWRRGRRGVRVFGGKVLELEEGEELEEGKIEEEGDLKGRREGSWRRGDEAVSRLMGDQTRCCPFSWLSWDCG